MARILNDHGWQAPPAALRVVMGSDAFISADRTSEGTRAVRQFGPNVYVRAARSALTALLNGAAGAGMLLLSSTGSHAARFKDGVQETAEHKPAARRESARKQEWHVRAERHIIFHGNSTSLSLADEHDLLLIARAARVHNDYRLCVLEHAHSGRDDAANHLNSQRTQVVIHFLERSGEVPPDRLLSPAAMRALNIPASNEHSRLSGDPKLIEVRVLAH